MQVQIPHSFLERLCKALWLETVSCCNTSLEIFHAFIEICLWRRTNTDQTTGKRIAPQQMMSTRNRISFHRLYSLEPSSVDSMMMKATLARTWGHDSQLEKQKWIQSENNLKSYSFPCIYTHLQRDYNHKDFLLLVRQDVFNKSPACANQCQCDEQKSPFKSGRYKCTKCKHWNAKWFWTSDMNWTVLTSVWYNTWQPSLRWDAPRGWWSGSWSETETEDLDYMGARRDKKAKDKEIVDSRCGKLMR